MKSTVCHLIDTLARGGAETALLRLIRCGGEEYRHVVCFFDRDDTLRNEFEQAGAEVVNFGGLPHQNPAVAMRILRTLKRYEPEVLHTHLPMSQVVGRIFGRLAGVPKIISTHQNVRESPGYKGPVGALEQLTRRLSTVDIAVSEDVRRSHQSGIQTNWQVIYNAIDVETFRQKVSNADGSDIRRRFNAENDLLFINVGRYVEQKGQKYLIDAFSRLDQRGIPAKCLIVGWGDLRSELEARVQEHGLSETVFITGRTDEVERYYAAADAFIMSSIHEGLPVVLVEAMAAELPFITTDVPGTRDVVPSDQFLVPPHDADTLADGIEKLSNESVRKEFASIAGEFAHQFDVSRAVSKYQKIYANE